MLARRFNHASTATSGGIYQATDPQVLAVKTVDGKRLMAKARMAEARSHVHAYPAVADENAYDVLKSELVFFHRRGTVGNPSVYFSSFNGLPYGADLVFAGVARSEIVNTTIHATGRSNFTLAYSGVQTIINTGAVRINAGDHVLWTDPITHDGNLPHAASVPKHRIEGVSATKFLAGLQPVDEIKAEVILKTVALRVREAVRRTAPAAAAALLAQTRVGFAAAPADAAVILAECVQIVEDMSPVAKMYSYQDAKAPAHEVESMSAKDPVRRYVGYMLASVGVANTLWQPSRNSNEAQRHMNNVRRLNQLRDAANKYGSGRLRYVATDDGILNEDEARILGDTLANPGLYPEVPAQCSIDLQRFINRRYIGVCRKTASPGQQMDIQIGRFVST